MALHFSQIIGSRQTRRQVTTVALMMILNLSLVRRTSAEEGVDLKFLYYQEDDERIRVIAPAIQVEKRLSDSVSIRVEGIYNTISGATPTGAPPIPITRTRTIVTTIPSRTTTVSQPSIVYNNDAYDDDHDDDDHDDDDHRQFVPSRSYITKAGATPVASAPAAPASSTSTASSSSSSSGSTTQTQTVTEDTGKVEVPKADFDEIRYGMNLEMIMELEHGILSGLYAYSYEDDYISHGFALRDAIFFNQKNTMLNLGAALTYDQINPANQDFSETKMSYDFMVGVSQVIDRNTLFTANLTLGMIDGYLSDPYKVAEVNGSLVYENRPDEKTKQIVYLSLNRYVPLLDGSAELSYRYYTDDFGINAQTYGLAWYQKLGPRWILRPAVRYYDQSEADFYAVRFVGNPEYYSSDYRVSAFTSLGYGLKAIWLVNERLAVDCAIDRYVQEGKDSLTPTEVYPSATMVTIGGRIFW